MHADRTNRGILILFGVLLVIAGAAAGAAGLGLLGSGLRRAALVHNETGRWVGANGDWFWPAVAVVCLVLVLLCLRWLVAILFSTDRAGDLEVAGGGGAGATTLDPRAVAQAVADEVADYHDVDSARARLIGSADEPTVVLVVSVDRRADLALVRRRIETGAVAHVRAALDDTSLPIRIDLTISDRNTGRVS